MDMGTILLIEDDADIREGVRVLLTSEGYSVMEADCGKKGLQLLNETIDLVILDIMMPGMSGIITCEEMSYRWMAEILSYRKLNTRYCAY